MRVERYSGCGRLEVVDLTNYSILLKPPQVDMLFQELRCQVVSLAMNWYSLLFLKTSHTVEI